MVNPEIYPNPTVKKVIFQIKFPNLFYIDNMIGDIQKKIMNKFPESGLSTRKQMVFADIGSEFKPEDIKSKFKDMDGDINENYQKIWRFKTDNNINLNILNGSLDICSEHHKTYNSENGDKFRDIIMFVMTNFLEVTSLPVIKRIGVRYIDECPLFSKNNDVFSQYYNSVFPIDRFSIEDSKEMRFLSVVKRGDYNLIYQEYMEKGDDEYKFYLDFDGFAENIESENYLEITDDLHEIISDEYQESIKEPLREYMRAERG